MKPSRTPHDRTSLTPAFYSKTMLVGGEIGCVTLVIVLASVLGGLWLDRLLGTKPVLTIFFVFGSAPLSLALTYWLAMRAVRDMNPTPGAGKRQNSVIEEDIGE
ncbi:MAG: AtpZ/AtpI family protein [Anaerolineales bacterium]|nr:AtpZ/AtpI family protein [Anaerolineales bacterium]